MIYNISQLKAEILYEHYLYNTSIKKGLHPTLQSEFQEKHLKKGTNEWKYIDLENNLLPYKVYTINKRFVFNYL